MKIKHTPIYFILLTLLVCTGCWEDTVTYYGATFSDDDSSIVFMRDSHERRTSGQSMLIGSYPTRNNRYQLMIEDVDGSNRRAVGPETSQATDMSGVYFMKSAGYLLKRYGWAYESNKVVKFDLETEIETEVASINSNSDSNTCANLSIVPSPDGSVLAALREPADCNDFNVILEFIQASDLSVIESKALILDAPLEPNNQRFLLYTWTVDGEFVVANLGTTGPGYAYAPGAQPIEVDKPECDWPKTTSSTYSAREQSVSFSGSEAILETSVAGLSFPCVNNN